MAPKGIGDKPFLPNIPDAIAVKIAAKVSLLMEVSWLDAKAEGQTFWEWVKNHPEIPIIITEGGKKALAAISQGHLALSLFGCNCGVTELTVKPELLPYVEGRNRVIIALDEDQKEKTKKTVFYATKKLARAINYHAKGKPFIASWDSYLGKGLDDLISQYPEVFHAAIDNALSYEKWKQYEHTDLTPYISITVNDRYLPKSLAIPENTRVICLKSPKGTGKTKWLSYQVEQALKKHQRVVVIIHREQLAKELSSRFGVPYRTEIKECAEGSINGYTLCIDSLHPNAKPPFKTEEWVESCVIIDECEQVLWHSLNSSTCEYNRPAILETLRNLFNNASRIYLSDADLTKISVDYVLNSLDEPTKPYIIVNNWKREPRNLYCYDKPEHLMCAVQNAIENGDKVIIHSGGQKAESDWGTVNLEKVLKQKYPELKILRIDSVSVTDPDHLAYGCMGNLNSVLALYDVVIASPTLETGVSIDIKHFDHVFCFASGSQTVGAVLQSIERVRDNVSRHIWIKEYPMRRIGNGSTEAYRLMKGQLQNSKDNIRFLQHIQFLAEADSLASDNGGKTLNLDTWSKIASIHNYGFLNYRYEIESLAEKDGYTLLQGEVSSKAETIKELVKETKDFNYYEHRKAVSEAPILDEKEYAKVKDKRAKKTHERLSEEKTDLSLRYATENVTPELIKQNDKQGWYKGLLLHYYLTTGNPYLKERDTKKVENLKNENTTVFTPDLNRTILSGSVAILGIIVSRYLDPNLKFTNESERPFIDNLIRPCTQQIKDQLGISINLKLDPMKIIQDLLWGTLKLRLTCTGQPTIEGKRSRVYQMTDPNPDDRMEIFRRWLERDQDASSRTTCTHFSYNRNNDLNQSVCSPGYAHTPKQEREIHPDPTVSVNSPPLSGRGNHQGSDYWAFAHHYRD